MEKICKCTHGKGMHSQTMYFPSGSKSHTACGAVNEETQGYCSCMEFEESNMGPAESVDHPNHYGGDTVYECIKVIEAWGLGFNLGNVLKYISRNGKKPNVDAIEDLKKAANYIQFEIKKLEKKNGT